jgi:dihydroneopterin aldolase
MYNIHLNQLVFEARHGVYPSEKVNPGIFTIDVELGLELGEKVVSLCDTVDYAHLYSLISERMSKPTPLLETLAHDISAMLLESDGRIRSISMKITKCNPPIPEFRGSVSVSLTKNR